MLSADQARGVRVMSGLKELEDDITTQAKLGNNRTEKAHLLTAEQHVYIRCTLKYSSWHEEKPLDFGVGVYPGKFYIGW